MSPLMGPDAAAYAWPDRRVRCRVTSGLDGRPVPNASRPVHLEVATYLEATYLEVAPCLEAPFLEACLEAPCLEEP